MTQIHSLRREAKFRVAYARLVHDFDLVLAVELEEPETVEVARVGGSQRFELTWHVHEDGPTRTAFDLYAKLRVPRFLPLEGSETPWQSSSSRPDDGDCLR